jgi:SAM-dependent methyltransferase
MHQKSRDEFIKEINYRAFDSLYRQGFLKQRFSHLAQTKHRTLRFGLKTCGLSPREERILDLGFGTAQTLLSFSPQNSIAGVEISDESLRIAQTLARRKGFQTFDFRKPEPDGSIPFKDASFDLVICSHLLEHLPDDRRMLQEIRRLLAPDGFGVVLIPLEQDVDGVLPRDSVEVDDMEVLARGGRYHVRQYNHDTFLHILSENELEIRFAYMNEYLWDMFKSFFRKRLHRRIPLIGRAFSGLFNVSLALLPHPVVRGADYLCKLAGRRPRQGLYIFQRKDASG